MSTTVGARSGRQVAFTIAQFAKATNLSLLSIDSKGDIEFANPSACKLFGYEQSEMIGQPITIIIPTRMRGAHMAELQQVAGGGEAPQLKGRPVEVSALRKDGTEFPIEITLSVWSGKRGFVRALSSQTLLVDGNERLSCLDWQARTR